MFKKKKIREKMVKILIVLIKGMKELRNKFRVIVRKIKDWNDFWWGENR